MKKTKLLQPISLVFALLLFCASGIAQRKLSGIVEESKNNTPLEGATVTLKNSNTTTVSKEQGKFEISVPNGKVSLVVSFVGYQTQTLPVGADESSITIKLIPSAANQLSDVVVVGYGTQRKVNLSGAVNTVDTKQLTNRPVTSLTNALQGTVPGVVILARPGDVGSDVGTVNIRGRGNLGTSNPLYVVDGVPVSGADFARINPLDVESISVLKDASASAIYGSRAAYGVILVTTKKGKGGKMSVSYNGYYGEQSPTVLPHWLGSYDYAVLRNEAATNAGKSPLFSPAQLQMIQNQSSPDSFPNNDWYKLTLKKSAPIMEHEINISGGGKTRYFLSGSYFDQSSLLPGKDLKRYSLRSNTETQVSDKFKIGSDVSFIRDGLNNTSGNISFVTLNRLVPLVVNQQSNGNWGSINGGKIDATQAAGNTLRTLAEGGRNSYVTNRIFASVNGTYSPMKGLDINGLISYNLYNSQSSAFTNTIDPVLNFISGKPISGTGVSTNQLAASWENSGKLLTQATGSYEFKAGKSNAKLFAGASYEQYKDNTLAVTRKNFVTNDLNSINAGSSDPLNTTSSGGIQENAIQSFFGRFNYSYNNKFLFEASMRADGSSQFAPGHRWGYFPSFSGAWRISQENFLSSVTWISELKLRASWGKLGNISNVGNYDFYDGINTGTAVILDQSKQDGAWPGKLANPTLSWEKIDMTNIGLDANLFDNKLTFQLDAFNRMTNGILLVNPSLPDEAGLTSSLSPSVNLAKVQNKGFELSLSHNNHIGNFNYSIGGNVSRIWNKIVNLGGQGDQINSPWINRVGEPIGAFYMWEAEGLFTDSADVKKHATQSVSTGPGDIKYKDINGDGKIDGNDRTIVGNDVPSFYYGININASYKNFDFSLLGQGVSNVKVYLSSEASQAFFNGAGVKEYMLGRWTKDNANPNASYPRMLISSDNTQNLQTSSFWLFNAAYFRIKELSIGYSIPQSVLDRAHIERVRVYVSSNNPFTIRADKRMNDFDPEMASTRASYPQLKTYSVGLNVTL